MGFNYEFQIYFMPGGNIMVQHDILIENYEALIHTYEKMIARIDRMINKLDRVLAEEEREDGGSHEPQEWDPYNLDSEKL